MRIGIQVVESEHIASMIIMLGLSTLQPSERRC